MTCLPVVTVLIPARNEAGDIRGALDSILAQDYPANFIEVVVVDGASTDDTASVALDRLRVAGLRRWSVLPNPKATTPSNLNVGLADAQGDIVCRVDARSRIPRHYIRTCVETLLSRPEVAVVGGAQVAIRRENDGVIQRGIVRALNNSLGMGFSRYRRNAPSGPSDTVYLGTFRTSELRDAGGWDERFGTNQDYELNRRMGRRGEVWFDASLVVGYLPRRTLRELFQQYKRFGSWKVDYWRMTGDRPQPRQMALLIGPAILASAAVLSVGAGPMWWRLAAGPLALAGAVTVDRAGNHGKASVTEHSVAIVALGAVGVGWVAGAWRRFLSKPR